MEKKLSQEEIVKKFEGEGNRFNLENIKKGLSVMENLVNDISSGDLVRIFLEKGEFVGYYKEYSARSPSEGRYDFYNVRGSREICGDSVPIKEGILFLDGGRFPKNYFPLKGYEILDRNSKKKYAK